MSQTRLGSWVEVTVNVVIGYVVALLTQALVFPLFGIIVPLSDHLMIGLFFLVVSIIRSYIVRRTFEHFGLFNKVNK